MASQIQIECTNVLFGCLNSMLNHSRVCVFLNHASVSSNMLK